MSDTEEHIIEGEPLRVLSLFRKREATKEELTSEEYERFYHMLCCTICCELLNNPVYLKCSHRFCKSCIEKHIRTNVKKSCPNCRGSLNTKRDLHSDFALETLINFAFGNTKLLIENIEAIDNLEAKAFVLNKKQETFYPIKRMKSEELDLELPKKRIKRSKKLNDINKEENISEAFDEAKINSLETVLKIKTLASNQTKINYIEIESESEEKNIIDTNIIKKECITPIKMFQENEDIKNEVGLNHDLLRKEFGSQYIKKALELTPLECYLDIQLVKISRNVFTPEINCKKICLSIKSPLSKVVEFIAKKLNIKSNRVHLYENSELPLINLNEKLLELNERIWKSLEGFEIFKRSEILNVLKHWPEHSFKRIIKYSIEIFSL